MTELPFKSDPTKPLSDEILNNYIIPTAKWLTGHPSSGYLLPQIGNSSWECSLSIWYLIDVYPKLPADLQRAVKAKIAQTAHWIAEQAEEDGEYSIWEGVTWDTAVCIRAILRAVREFPDRFSDKQRETIERAAARGTKWLIHTFKKWETDVLYPFGISDVAQILVTFVYLAEHQPAILEKGSKGEYPGGGMEAISELARHLVDGKDDCKPEEEKTFWGDFFQSAEVLEALADYIAGVHSGKVTNQDPTFVAKCEVEMGWCITHFECNQSDGKWGTHSDHCRALYGYIRATTVLEQSQEHHVVMKALRWVCDPKQTFRDGSFMHTTFLTVFYAIALWEVFEKWKPAQEPVIVVLDKALWSSPVRSTPERAARLRLDVMHKKEIEQNEELRMQLKRVQEREASVRRQNRIGAGAAIALVLLWALGTSVGVFTNVFTIITTDRQVLIGFLGFMGTLTGAIVALFTWLLAHNRD